MSPSFHKIDDYRTLNFSIYLCKYLWKMSQWKKPDREKMIDNLQISFQILNVQIMIVLNETTADDW